MKFLTVLAISILAAQAAGAQTIQPPAADTLHVQMKEIEVRARWANDTDRYHYNQTKYYITTILPYLNAATKTFNDLRAAEAGNEATRRDRKKLEHAKEDQLRTQFEDEVKQLNVTQGKLLVTLIARQTGGNIYQMLHHYKNTFTAIKWQAWARVNGMDLDKKYYPDSEPMLEQIMYELGYPLPDCYRVK